VIEAARRSTGVRSAGFLEGSNQRIVISTEGQVRTAEQLAQTPVAVRNAVTLRLGDVAVVRNAAAPAEGAASINGQPGVMLLVESQFGADPLRITEAGV
jgi:multidrug efflux pump subunit AcrB